MGGDEARGAERQFSGRPAGYYLVFRGERREAGAMENEEQLLPILFDVPAEGRGEFMTTAQISERLVTYGNIKRPMPLNRLGMLLGQMGFKNIRAGKQRVCGWLVYQYSQDEIRSMQKIYAK